MPVPVPLEMLFSYAGVAALVLIVVLASAVIILSRRVRRLTLGKEGEDLSKTIASLGSRIADVELFRKELEEYLYAADKRIKRSIQGVATVRFNPFEGDGSGGSQSFATAFIDEEGTGAIISTIYTRERVSTFGKPLVKGASTYELTDEEQEAVHQARANLKGSLSAQAGKR